jgi:hypothetical protein
MIPGRRSGRLSHDGAALEDGLQSADTNIFKKSAKGAWQGGKIPA